MRIADFSRIWVVDTEFYAPDGERQTPICLVARELNSRQMIRWWHDELPSAPPYDPDYDLLVAYYASAELGTFLAAGWEFPAFVIDLFAEHRVLTNGVPQELGSGLVGAALSRRIDDVPVDKESMQQLARRGEPFTGEERQHLLRYCESDVETTVKLFRALVTGIDVDRALIRGSFSAAVARMEWRGVPIDMSTLSKLAEGWVGVCNQLIAETPRAHEIIERQKISQCRLAEFLIRNKIHDWPTTPKAGLLSTNAEDFEKMAELYPQLIGPIAKLNKILTQGSVGKLAVGLDQRNRVLLSQFGTATGRCTPSSSQFIFGRSSMFRGLIQPVSGTSLIYADWSGQEFGVVAALSGDRRMMDDYQSGDHYVAFAKRVGLMPEHGTKHSHSVEREKAKATMLGMNYGMTAHGLAMRLKLSVSEAEQLIRFHRRTYAAYWEWAESAINYALLQRTIHTTFGWCLHLPWGTPDQINLRALQNFPAQANGAEMLRLACISATKDGLGLCATLHDALLVECPAEDVQDTMGRLEFHMGQASEVVLNGFRLRTEFLVINHPGRFLTPDTVKPWERIAGLVGVHECGLTHTTNADPA